MLAGLLLAACGAAAPSPTAASTAAPLPPARPSATVASTGTPLPAGPCANPLVPLLPGASWIYAITGLTTTEQVVIAVVAVSEGHANLHIQVAGSGSGAQITASCENGAITSFPPVFLVHLLSGILGGDLVATTLYGVYAPSTASLEKNGWVSSWNRVELLQEGVKVSLPGSNDTVFTTVNSEMIVDMRSAGERVALTVPVGSYPQALKVAGVARLPVTRLADAGSQDGELTVQFSQWYQPYVGLLQMQVDSAGVAFGSGARAPFPVNVAVQLIRYQPGG